MKTTKDISTVSQQTEIQHTILATRVAIALGDEDRLKVLEGKLQELLIKKV